MKLKLLLLATLMLLSIKNFAQVSAYPVPDITQCNYEVFDLTVNSPIALGNQNPENFTVSYYHTLANAQNNANAFPNPTAYVPYEWSEVVYYSVRNVATAEFATGSFTITVASPFLVGFPDVMVCGDSYTLETLPASYSYYTGPQGTGLQLSAGSTITQTMEIYIFDSNSPCEGDTMFSVIIGGTPDVQMPTPLLACDATFPGVAVVDLTSKALEIWGNQLNVFGMWFENLASAEAGINSIPNPGAYTSPALLPYVIYVRVESQLTGCYEVVPLEVISGGCTDNNLTGTVTYDMDGNGCSSADSSVSGLPVIYTAGNYIATTFTNVAGTYQFSNLPDGIGSVSLSQPAGYIVSPASQQVTYPGNTDEPNFCLTVLSPVNDVTVTITPISGAQAGFASYYILTYENNGSLPASGTITLQYDAANLTYNSSVPNMADAGNTLTLAYNNLQPFQSGTVSLTFTVMLPQITPAGTLLTFVATIDPVTGDAYPADNTYTLMQTVVNSWDPNDITVSEGEFITEEQADDYLHYTIRFQNKGNASAVNVAVENPVDSNLDITTLQPLSASHDYSATVHNGIVTFNFDDINLTWEDNDELGSQGYVSYRIKPLPALQAGDHIEGGSAGIFFDFNDPVMTNVVTTTIQTLGSESFAKDAFLLYPNPASGSVTLQFAAILNNADVIIANVLGKTVWNKNLQANGGDTHLDICGLTKGVYFVTATIDGIQSTQKLIVK